jgi:hypothetical protein
MCLTSALDGTQRSTSRPRRFTSAKRVNGSHRTECRVDPLASVDDSKRVPGCTLRRAVSTETTLTPHLYTTTNKNCYGHYTSSWAFPKQKNFETFMRSSRLEQPKMTDRVYEMGCACSSWQRLSCWHILLELRLLNNLCLNKPGGQLS